MLTRCKSGSPREFLPGHAQVEKWRRLAATRSKSRNGSHFAATGTKLRRACICFCRWTIFVFSNNRQRRAEWGLRAVAVLVAPVHITDRLPCAQRSAKTFGERVVLSINFVFVFVCVAMACIFQTGLDMCCLQENKGKIKCSKCMLRIDRRSIGFEERSSSHSTDH